MIWVPSTAEVDAAERVLAEAAGQSPDGFWRPTAEAVLQAADRARRDAILKREDQNPMATLRTRAQKHGILTMDFTGKRVRYRESRLRFDEEVVAESHAEGCRMLLGMLREREAMAQIETTAERERAILALALGKTSSL